jgi:hypothetical protein
MGIRDKATTVMPILEVESLAALTRDPHDERPVSTSTEAARPASHRFGRRAAVLLLIVALAAGATIGWRRHWFVPRARVAPLLPAILVVTPVAEEPSRLR